jgi:hypothetical protein
MSDHARLEIDVFKHLTTLSTGAIVLLAAFLDKMKGLTSLRIAIPIAATSLLVCLIFSVKGVFLAWIANRNLMKLTIAFMAIEAEDKQKQLADVQAANVALVKSSRGVFNIVQYSFMLGIGSMAAFIVCNFIQRA